MRQKFIEMDNTTFNPDSGDIDPNCCAQIAINKGFWYAVAYL